MKVCLVTRYFSFQNAGLGRVSSEILSGLKSRPEFDVRTVSTNGTSLPSYFAYTLFEIPLRLPRGCDVYHILTPMEGIWAPKDRSIVTFYDLIPLKYPERCGAGLAGSGWKNTIGRVYFKWASSISARASRVVCISEETKKDVMEVFGTDEKKISVIRLGIRPDLEPQEPTIERNGKLYRKERERLTIGYLGQLDRRKRVDLLVRKFRRSRLDAQLVIGGTGIDEAELKELAGRDSRISFEGFLPDEFLPTFYNSLDVFVFPTWVEGYGLPPVEAMACKKPVVVLDDAIIPWEVKKRCIITKDLGLLFSNEVYLRGQMASVDIEGNYAWAKSHSWKECLDKYIEIYKEVAGG